MTIDDFINSKQGNHDRNGSNKECFLFENHVLLYGSCKEEELKKVIQITNSLEQKGVAILPTLEYKIDSAPNELGYARGYFLQKRAQGKELYSSKMSEDEYKKRLNEVSKMSTEQMDKFVSDWLTISEAGLMIDPSKCGNFFYSDGKISFIDLNLAKRSKSLGEKFSEVSNVLFGLGLKSKYKTDGNDFMKILENVSKSFLKKGLSLSEIKAITSKYSYFMDKDKIDSVINDLSKEEASKGLFTRAFSKPAKTPERQEKASTLLETLRKRDKEESKLTVVAFQQRKSSMK